VAEEYDELDHRQDEQLWLSRDSPDTLAPAALLEEVDRGEGWEEEEDRPSPEPIISPFAIGRLCR